MKFKDMNYERPDYAETAAAYGALLDELEAAKSPAAFLEVFRRIDVLRGRISTMASLAEIRHSINTKDEFYDRENEYWDETNPKYEVFENRLSRIAVNCPFRTELYGSNPEPFFLLAECRLKSFREDLVPLLQKENRLASEYGKLKASAAIPFEGKIYNLSSISPLTEDTDRNRRKAAMDARLAFYASHEADFDRIYDELVRVRTEIARRLGFETFTKLGYLRMNRLDYDEAMTAVYRNEILSKITPAVTRLYEMQAERLGIDKVAYFDRNMEFCDGNPVPRGTASKLTAAAGAMYHEMSPETGEFIDVMADNELWDLESRDGKEMGGYCTSIQDWKVPFIFANFNGTSGDVNVLTHEAGHAFQYYLSRNIPVSDLQWPTMEAAEIASMTMEFNAWPWLDRFFGEDADRYRFVHLTGTLKFLPYGVLVDHFQHEVYAHPDWTPQERKSCWRKLEQMYEPYLDYEGAPLLEKGCWWYQQGHIFELPFYYIDYTLAQVCALQFWARGQKKDPDVWKDYVTLCKLGGTRTFTGLVKAAGLKVPFEPGCLNEVSEAVHAWLDSAPGAGR